MRSCQSNSELTKTRFLVFVLTFQFRVFGLVDAENNANSHAPIKYSHAPLTDLQSGVLYQLVPAPSRASDKWYICITCA